MPLNDAKWGWCFGCNREVEVRMGVLIDHGRTEKCTGSGTAPRTPPREGTWAPPQKPRRSEPGPMAERAVIGPLTAAHSLWHSFFQRTARRAPNGG